MNDGAKALYGALIGAGGSSGGGGGSSLKTFKVEFYHAGSVSGVHEFAFEPGMTWDDYIASPLCPPISADDYYGIFSLNDDSDPESSVNYVKGNGAFLPLKTADGDEVLGTYNISDTDTYWVDFL